MFDEFKKLKFVTIHSPWWNEPHSFFADDGGDGGDDGGKKTGGGGDDKGKGADDGKKDDPKPQTYQVKIGGEIRELSLQELMDHASKAAGADEKFREAAKLREQAEHGMKVAKAFDKVFKSDSFTAADLRELAELTGQDADELIKSFNAELGKEDKDDKTGKKAPSAGAKIKFEDLPDDVQEFIKEAQDVIPAAKEDQVAKAEVEIKNAVKKEVDKDEFFGKIIMEAPEDQREGIKEAIVGMVHRDVRAKILASPYTKEKFGPEMIRNSNQVIRAEVKKLGIPTKSSKQSDRLSLLAGLGQIGGLPAEVYSDDNIERVSSTDPNYEDNSVKRLGQMMRRAVDGG